MKKVAVIGTVGIPANYGGFEALVENLTKNSSETIKYEVFCSTKNYEQQLKEHNGAKLIYIPLNANGVQSVLYDTFSLLRCLLTKPQTVVILGVSGCIFLPVFKLISCAKIITNIDGLEWKRDKWGRLAKSFLKISEFLAVRCSDVVIADNQAIADYVLAEYSFQAVTIAYGGDHALQNNLEINFTKKCYSLALCRIEPENNVDMILEAFSKSKKPLKFVGNWDSSNYGKRLKEKYSKYENIEIIDPIYDLRELYYLRTQCDNYIHGHSAGGTNPSLVEMMHFNKTIFCFDCNFNRYTTENKALYFSSIDSLIDNMNNFEGNASVGKSMSEIAARRYTWKKVVDSYESLY